MAVTVHLRVWRRYLTGLLLGLAVLASGCRDIQPYQPPTAPVQGYAIRGKVTTPNGVPVESVAVSLDYELDRINSAPIDTAGVMIPNPPRLLTVEVFNARGQFIRQMYVGVPPSGRMARLHWNGFAENGRPAPSGKYFIRYTLDTTIVKLVPFLLRRQVTTYTDAEGFFTISGNGMLPVFEQFDVYRNGGIYDGVYRVNETIYLLLQRSGLSRQATITLQLNTTYHGAFTLE